jgi:hypothetical protein
MLAKYHLFFKLEEKWMKKRAVFLIIIVLMLLLGACSKDTSGVTKEASGDLENLNET